MTHPTRRGPTIILATVVALAVGAAGGALLDDSRTPPPRCDETFGAGRIVTDELADRGCVTTGGILLTPRVRGCTDGGRLFRLDGLVARVGRPLAHGGGILGQPGLIEAAFELECGS